MPNTIGAHEIHHEASSCQATSCGYTGNHPGALAFLTSIMADFNTQVPALETAMANAGHDLTQAVTAAAGQFMDISGKGGR